MSPVLKLESPSIWAHGLDVDGALTLTRGAWTIRERRWYDALEPAPSYQLEIAVEVPVGEDPGGAYIWACAAARDFDHAFCYATGRALTGTSYEYFLVPQRPPKDWRLAASDAELSEEDRTLLAGLAFDHPIRSLPSAPLTSCGHILDCIDAADSVVSELFSLHYGAYSSDNPDLAPLLFARCLEIARALLPGGTDAQRQSRMPRDLQACFGTRSLAWLYEVSNTRRETRHPITKSSGIALHTSLSPEELTDYLRLADLVTRYAVCDTLGLPLMLCEEGVSRVAG